MFIGTYIKMSIILKISYNFLLYSIILGYMAILAKDRFGVSAHIKMHSFWSKPVNWSLIGLKYGAC